MSRGLCLAWNLAAGGSVDDDLEAMLTAAPYRGAPTRAVSPKGDAIAAFCGIDPYDRDARPQVHVDAEAELLAVADARLDNRDELCRTLRLVGDEPDIAIIVAAYRRWGTEAPAALLGDFALAVVDGRAGHVLLARDPMAMRPLCYRLDAHRLLVASEAHQIAAVAGVPRDVDERHVLPLLRAADPPLDTTGFAGISQVEPAHGVLASHHGVQRWRFWDIDPSHRIIYRDEAGYAAHLRDVLVEATAARLRHRASAGILLSGGVDSGAVASIGGWLRARGDVATELRAYCWDFTDYPECEERHLSRLVTDAYGIPAIDVPIGGHHPMSDWASGGSDPNTPYLIAFQPGIDAALRSAAADGVGVLLGGDRGDLMVGDWGLNYLQWLRQRRWRLLASQVREQGAVTGQSALAVFGATVLPRMLRRLREAPEQWRDGPTSRPEHPPWLRSSARHGAAAPAVPDHLTRLDFGQRERYASVFAPLHMHGIPASERSYARHGLAFADPWSDRRIAEFAIAVPQHALNRPYEHQKRLAREALRGIMPESLRRGAAKIVPQRWFDDALRRLEVATARSVLTDMRAADLGWVDETGARDQFEGYVAGSSLPPALWWLLCVEQWLRQHWAG